MAVQATQVPGPGSPGRAKGRNALQEPDSVSAVHLASEFGFGVANVHRA